MGVWLTTVTGRILPVLALALLAASPGVAELLPNAQNLYFVETERQTDEGDYESAAATR